MSDQALRKQRVWPSAGWLVHGVARMARVALQGLAALAWLVPLLAAAQTPAAAPARAPALAAPAPAHAVPDTLAQRLMACTGCHGAQGRATASGYFPRIAGKPADYLYRQLLNFRDGQRQHAGMAWLLKPLDDAYLAQMAQHFAALNLPYPPPEPSRASAAQLARGQQLVVHGDPGLKVPACVACHGQALTGVAPALPALLGLPREYLVVQLGAWRTGLRRASAPDCMAQTAQRLSGEDVAAVAAWLAAQPVPADSRPAAQAPGPVPMPCGSGLPQGLQAGEPGGAPHGADAGSRHAAGTAPGTRSTGYTRNAGSSAPAPAPAHAPAAPPAAAAQADPAQRAQVARGAYLARAGNCAACHSQPGGAPYAGGPGIATPFGTAFGGNLTPDVATGLGAWNADDFWRALTQGRGRDGRRLVPAFPYTDYTLLHRADSDALFAYLRSLRPVVQPNRPQALRWPFGTQVALAVWQGLFFSPGVWVDQPGQSADWNRGAYLVRGLGHCAACHGQRNALGALRDAPRPAGGQLLQPAWYAPSLVSPHEAGVADWPLADVVQLLQTGRSPRGAALGPMADVVLASTQHLNASDLRAMAVYLQALPVSAGPPAAARGAASDQLQRGAAVYRQHCASCHGAAGQGAPGAYSALAGNRAVTMDPPTNVLQLLLHGGFSPSTAGQPQPFGMPPSGLGDDDLAAVATYIRQSWGHRASAVSSLQVQRLRDRR